MDCLPSGMALIFAFVCSSWIWCKVWGCHWTWIEERPVNMGL